jgi:hypothetical protein
MASSYGTPLRDSDTASKVLRFAGIDQFQRADNTQWRIALQEVYRVEAFLAFDIDQMAEVPTYEVIGKRAANLEQRIDRWSDVVIQFYGI